MVWNIQPLQPEPQQSKILTQPEYRPKIHIGIPHESRFYAEWTFKMFVPLHISVDWCDNAFPMMRGLPQNLARDEIVKAALADKDVTHILWVDSDNVCVNPPNPNDAMRMLFTCNQPVVSGLYRAKQKEGFNYAAWVDAKQKESGFYPVQNFDGNWIQVDAVGFGFILIAREVYETCPPPWHVWDKPKPSEDFSACALFRKYGYKINVFTDVKLRHLGELGVNPDGSVSVPEV